MNTVVKLWVLIELRKEGVKHRGAEGTEIAAFVWGRVTFVDLGLALVLGWLWIASRERSVARALVWLLLTAVTGSGALLVYVSIAAWRTHTLHEVLVGRRRAAWPRPRGSRVPSHESRPTTRPPGASTGGTSSVLGGFSRIRDGGVATKTVGVPSGGEGWSFPSSAAPDLGDGH